MLFQYYFTSLSLFTLTIAQTTCPPGYAPGRDEVIFTLPYTYAQVMSIIGSYRNITWSGSPYDTVTLNGTDNTVGTARTYDVVGAHVVETITVYSKPANGPYSEVHTVDLLTVPSANVSFFSAYDGTTVVQACGGKASTMNVTITVCASNVTVAESVLHTIHLTDAQTVGVFLGNKTFTSCDALGATGTSTGAPVATFTGAAEKVLGGLGMAAMGVGAVLAVL